MISQIGCNLPVNPTGFEREASVACGLTKRPEHSHSFSYFASVSYGSRSFLEFGNTSIFTHDKLRSSSMNVFNGITGSREKLIFGSRGGLAKFYHAVCCNMATQYLRR